MPLPAMKQVFSENVNELGYDPDTSELYVVWASGKTAGRTSVYAGVPAEVAKEVMNSWSIGDAIRTTIKPAYRHRYVS